MPEAQDAGTTQEAGVDDLERRLASFEAATRRLKETVGDRRFDKLRRDELKDSGARHLPGDLSSGLRPGIFAPNKQTSALLPHARGQAVPGFTSAFGKPAVALMPSTQPPTGRASVGNRRRWQWAIIAGLFALGLLIATLPRRFPVLPDAGVWADAVTVNTISSGETTIVPIRVGDPVKQGQLLARIGGSEVTSPVEGVVGRLLVSVGTRLKGAEPVAEIVLPSSRRIVVALPGNLSPTVGDLVRIDLLADQRTIDGNIEQILLAGVPGPWISDGASPRRAIIQPAPSPLPISLRQGARVTIIGSTPLKRLAFAVRDMLPW